MMKAFDTMNRIQKFHAILVSPLVRVWEYPFAETSKRFMVQYLQPAPGDYSNLDGNFDQLGNPVSRKVTMYFTSLEGMIDAAYAIIDPLVQPLPEKIIEPTE